MRQVIDLLGISNEAKVYLAITLAETLRAADREELNASSGLPPEEVIALAIEYSQRLWGLFEDGKLKALWGTCPFDEEGPDVGCAWLLATDYFDDLANARFIMATSKKYIEIMQSDYRILFNWVSANHEKALAWIRWVGFRPTDVDLNYGVQFTPFIKFVRV